MDRAQGSEDPGLTPAPQDTAGGSMANGSPPFACPGCQGQFLGPGPPTEKIEDKRVKTFFIVGDRIKLA